MECFFLSATRTIAGWYHFPFHGQPTAGPESGECQGKEFPCSFALFSPTKFYGGKGNSFPDRKSTRLNSSHQIISYAVFCLKKKKKKILVKKNKNKSKDTRNVDPLNSKEN